jgi:hypothetical protein
VVLVEFYHNGTTDTTKEFDKRQYDPATSIGERTLHSAVFGLYVVFVVPSWLSIPIRGANEYAPSAI